MSEFKSLPPLRPVCINGLTHCLSVRKKSKRPGRVEGVRREWCIKNSCSFYCGKCIAAGKFELGDRPKQTDLTELSEAWTRGSHGAGCQDDSQPQRQSVRVFSALHPDFPGMLVIDAPSCPPLEALTSPATIPGSAPLSCPMPCAGSPLEEGVRVTSIAMDSNSASRLMFGVDYVPDSYAPQTTSRRRLDAYDIQSSKRSLAQSFDNLQGLRASYPSLKRYRFAHSMTLGYTQRPSVSIDFSALGIKR